MLGRLRQWAGTLKRDVVALWCCYRDPRTPLAAKILAMVVVAYALSPIDLVPDFIPVLGYLDDLILLPGVIYLTIKLIPVPVLTECRDKALAWLDLRRARPTSYVAAVAIILIWLALGWLAWRIISPLLASM